jgi:hypothetical protein
MRLAAPLLLSAALFAGCVLPADQVPEDLPEDLWVPPGAAFEPVAQFDEAPLSRLADDVDVDGLVEAPQELALTIGEEMDVELRVLQPSLAIQAVSLPERAAFYSMESGARVQWVPEPSDIGRHEFVFLVVDAAEPNLVLAQTSILVDVLPGFSLIEYGF